MTIHQGKVMTFNYWITGICEKIAFEDAIIYYIRNTVDNKVYKHRAKDIFSAELKEERGE